MIKKPIHFKTDKYIYIWNNQQFETGEAYILGLVSYFPSLLNTSYLTHKIGFDRKLCFDYRQKTIDSYGFATYQSAFFKIETNSLNSF